MSSRNNVNSTAFSRHLQRSIESAAGTSRISAFRQLGGISNGVLKVARVSASLSPPYLPRISNGVLKVYVFGQLYFDVAVRRISNGVLKAL